MPGNRLWKKWFYDGQGKPAVWQPPNPPLFVWFGSTVLAHVTSGKPELFFTVIAFGALFTWAWSELFSGINYFRRTIGLVILCTIVITATTRGHF